MTDTNKCKESFFSIERTGEDELTITQFENGKMFNLPLIIDLLKYRQIQIINPKKMIYFSMDWSTDDALTYTSGEM